MTLQHRCEGRAALGLQDNCIYLARDGAMRRYAKTAGLLRSAGRDPELMDGRMLALYQVNGPEDVHCPIWEMHPDGDELLILTSGSLSVECRDGGTGHATPLPPHAAFIVPAGIWHRLIVHASSVMIGITPRHNTVHESG